MGEHGHVKESIVTKNFVNVWPTTKTVSEIEEEISHERKSNRITRINRIKKGESFGLNRTNLKKHKQNEQEMIQEEKLKRVSLVYGTESRVSSRKASEVFGKSSKVKKERGFGKQEEG